MFKITRKRTLLYGLILSMGLFASAEADARWWGGYHGGGYNGGGFRHFHGGFFPAALGAGAAAAVLYGATYYNPYNNYNTYNNYPYYGNSYYNCQTVQQCDVYGVCSQYQVCN